MRFDEVGEFIELFASIACTAGSANTADVVCIVEDAEFAATLEHIHEFYELHTEAHVGFVATEAAHGFVPRHTKEGFIAQIVVAYLFEEVFCEPFEGIDDVILFNKGHLAVDLGKFGLAVGA